MRYKKGDYIFASTYVRGLERNLLDRNRLDKLVAVRSSEEAIRILGEIGYDTEEAAKVADSVSIDSMLQKRLSMAYSDILGAIPDKGGLDVFLLLYDYHNLKVLVKAELSGATELEGLVNLGKFGPDRLRELMREREFVYFHYIMREGVLEALDSGAKSADPQLVDMVLDKACYEHLTVAAEESGIEYMKGYVGLLADTTNIKTFVRCRKMNAPRTAFSRAFLPGGDIEENVFLEGYNEEYAAFSERLRAYENFEEVMERGGAELSSTGRFTLLERLCDDAIINYAEKAKHVSWGMEVPAGYIIAMENEVRIVRILLAAISQGLPPEDISTRMRRTYV